MAKYRVAKAFNKYKTVGEVIELPNEFISGGVPDVSTSNQIEELLKSGHIVGPMPEPKKESPLEKIVHKIAPKKVAKKK